MMIDQAALLDLLAQRLQHAAQLGLAVGLGRFQLADDPRQLRLRGGRRQDLRAPGSSNSARPTGSCCSTSSVASEAATVAA